MENQVVGNKHQGETEILEEEAAGPEQCKEHFGVSGSEPTL